MKYATVSSKAWSENCIFCNERIKYEDYGYSKTKPTTYNGKRIPGKTLYFHMRCYKKEYIDIKKKPVEVVI